MKEITILLILTFITLSASKMIEYLRYIKFHNEQVNQMELFIGELKAKQKVLNQRVTILRNSEQFQKNSLNNLYANIYKIIDRLVVKDR